MKHRKRLAAFITICLILNFSFGMVPMKVSADEIQVTADTAASVAQDVADTESVSDEDTDTVRSEEQEVTEAFDSSDKNATETDAKEEETETPNIVLTDVEDSIVADSEPKNIYTAEDWDAFANGINDGTITSDGVTWLLKNDISVTTMVGTAEHPFAGTFNGDGHKLTVNISDTTNQGTAPFRYIAGALIRHLTVTGSVEGTDHAAGLVGFNQSGSSAIRNCIVETNVTAKEDADNSVHIGGVLGHNKDADIEFYQVVYSGHFTAYPRDYIGGLVGWSDSSKISITKCLFMGDFDVQGAGDLNAFSSLGLYNYSSSVDIDVEKFYYTRDSENHVYRYFTLDSLVGVADKMTKVSDTSQAVGIYQTLDSVDKTYYFPCSVEGLKQYYSVDDTLSYTIKNVQNQVLSEETDYEVRLKKEGTVVTDISVPGTYSIIFTGKGDYEGEYTAELKVGNATEIPYKDPENGTQTVDDFSWVQSANGNVTWDTGWYVVDGNVVINGNATIRSNGQVNLLLCDGAKLTVNGIVVNETTSLTIWAQGNETGTLIAKATENLVPGIGGGNYNDAGSITINGGIVKATGGSRGAGIGASYSYSGGTVVINGGKVTATGNEGPGIGGHAGTITINGGEVYAFGYSYSAGIGAGSGNNSGNITINGGTVHATGSNNAAGIGCGLGGTLGSITITGGTVTATGGHDAAAIGVGNGSYGGNISISGGNVTAVGYVEPDNIGYGIGVGVSYGTISAGSLTISGGTVKATSGYSNQSAGLYAGTNGTITVTGGNVEALAGDGDGHGFYTKSDGSTTLDYVDQGLGMSVKASDYVGTVVLNKAFMDFETERTFEKTDSADVNQLAGTTLIPAEIGVFPAAEFKKQSLTLSGEIGVNFFVYMDGLTNVEKSASYMTFTVGKSTEETRADFDGSFKNSTNEYYGFTCKVNAIQMADKIHAVFHYSKGGSDYTMEKEYSVTDYIATRLGESGVSEKEKTLIKALNDFGYYSQQYLSELRGWTIGTDYAGVAEPFTTDFDLDKIKSDTAGNVIQTIFRENDIYQVSFALKLDAETSVYLYVRLAEGYNGSFQALDLNDKDLGAVRQKDGRYLIKLDGKSAHELAMGDLVYFRTDTATTHATMTSTDVSPISYAYACLSNDCSVAKKKMAAAMYIYNRAAVDYINEINGINIP